jgi:NAD(P)-dependent dehydrogenase (short-subunit alcohol dehydrogenase family)
MRLKNRTAFITGSSQGIGGAIAIAFAREGASLILHGIKPTEVDYPAVAECQAICKSQGNSCDFIAANFLEPTEQVIPKVVSRVLDIAPATSILVNNAGSYMDKPFLDMDYRTYDNTMRLNVASGYFLAQGFAKHWIANKTIAPKILFTGSINGLLSEPDHSAYDASKAAVAGLTRSLCVALAPEGIRVNSIAPGLLRTPLTDKVLAVDSEVLKWMEIHTPNGQVPSADACCGAAIFLVSDEAEHVHGQTLYVDGGISVWQQPDLPLMYRSAK